MTHSNFISSLLLIGYKFNEKKNVLRYEDKHKNYYKIFIDRNDITYHGYTIPLSHDFSYMYRKILETLPGS